MPDYAEKPSPGNRAEGGQTARAFRQPDSLAEGISKYAARREGILLIIGEGEIGDKARSLARDAEGYRKAGLVVGERVVLAQSALEDFLRFNGICDTLEQGNRVPDIIDKILDPKARFPPELEEAISKTISQYPAVFPKAGMDDELAAWLGSSSVCVFDMWGEPGSHDLNQDEFCKKALNSPTLCKDEQAALELYGKISSEAQSDEGWEPDKHGRQKRVELGRGFFALMMEDGVYGHVQLKVEHGVEYSERCPAMLRSSAKRDDKGTGAYQSECSENLAGGFLAAFKSVLASYYAPKARDFREKAGTGEGFGIMLEPLAGSLLQNDAADMLYAPLFSGVAVFAPGKEPVVGLGLGAGAVVDGSGDHLCESDAIAAGGKFSAYIKRREKEAKARGWLFDSSLAYQLSGRMFLDEKKKPDGERSSVPGLGQALASIFSLRNKKLVNHAIQVPSGADDFDLRSLFSSFRTACEALGGRRVEFAVVLGGGEGQRKASVHILQSSIPSEKSQQGRLGIPKGEPICRENDIFGECDAKFRTFVRPDGYYWIEELEKYESSLGEGYVLLLPQNLTSHNREIFLPNAKGAMTFGEAQLETCSIHYSASRMLSHFANLWSETGRFVSSSENFPLHGPYHAEQVREPVLSGVPEDGFEAAFLEYNRQNRNRAMPEDGSEMEYFLKRAGELEAGSRYDSARFYGQDHYKYRAYKEKDGTISLWREYAFGIVQAPEGHHFHAVGNKRNALKIYLCKDE